MTLFGATGKRRGQPKRRGKRRGVKWLCNPRSFKVLLGIGYAFFRVTRIVIDVMRWFRD